jgi:hypothetical protein
MNSDLAFRLLFSEFGRSLLLDDMDLDANGYCMLEIDGIALDVNHLETEAEVILTATVAPLPAHPTALLLNWLLTENFDEANVSGAFFTIDTDDNAIGLVRRVSTHGLSVKSLTQEIETLIDRAVGSATEVKDRSMMAAQKPETAPEDDMLWRVRI